MKTKALPLKDLTIDQIYYGEKATYEVPIYQRNYAWEKEEIYAFINDVYDAFFVEKPAYYIGTLVTFNKGDNIHEIIDGQQRLTTIYLILHAMHIPPQNKLTYRARKKSDDTLKSLCGFTVDERDNDIVNGYKCIKEAIGEIVPQASQDLFKNYFRHNVILIHYQVPKDIDLNHYFEIMNSRGEQLEKHEIIKARLIEKLNDIDKAKFHQLWEFCSEMNVYIQQKYANEDIFGKNHNNLIINSFDGLPEARNAIGTKKIIELINHSTNEISLDINDQLDSFQPIIDFPNFLLIVLKITLTKADGFDPIKFNLDDKELINEFDRAGKLTAIDEKFVKQFGFNLLKAKYLLDNYIVHHSAESDTLENNPWKLQCWSKEDKRGSPKNLDGESKTQHKLLQLLSMFEVSFAARQRKNYLFYCLMFLFENNDIEEYYKFVSGLADKFYKDVYLVSSNLNEINTPKPGSFDSVILANNMQLVVEICNTSVDFEAIYGNGTTVSAGIPLFIFNYIDYKLWEKYENKLRGENKKEGSRVRKYFFSEFGCGDFGLKVFEQFYFSRTRRSLEHYFPQAGVRDDKFGLTKAQINCLGNYAMIGSEINSSGSDWTPKAKLNYYLDESGKIKLVSVASIKFMIMMQICKENQGKREPGQEWNFEDISAHQKNILEILC